MIPVLACGPKTVPVKRTFLNIAIVGWSGVGWGGMLTFLVLRTWYIAMLLRSLGSFTTLHVATLLMGWGGGACWRSLYFLHDILPCCWDLWDRLLRYMCWWGGVGWGGGACWRSLYFLHDILPCCWDLWDRLLRYMCWWGGVGWGVMLAFLVLRTWYIAMLLGSLGLFTTLHVATLLRSLGSFTTLYVATLLRSLGSFTTLHAATLLRSLGSFTTLHVLCGIAWKSQFPATCAKSDLLMVYARAWQWRCIRKNADCQLITVHALQRWRWKAKKRAPSFSRISNHQISTALW